MRLDDFAARTILIIALLSGLTATGVALADEGVIPPVTPVLPSRIVRLDVDSGIVLNQGRETAVVFSEEIRVPNATWMRLKLGAVALSGSIEDSTATILRLTATADGAVQTFDSTRMEQWKHTTAYFNGNAVLLEVIAAPGTGPNRVTVEFAWAGNEAAGDGVIASQCGPTDDRLPSEDPRSARVLPVGCTVFLIDDAAGCFLTAGHCASGGSLDVVQFNVPFSNGNGGLQHPPPEDQYATDPVSIQFLSGGIGNDWCYFGCFPNSETGLTPAQAQGGTYVMASQPPQVDGQTIRITGYGVDSSPPEWNQTQQTHSGPYIAFTGSRLQYQVDTTGGNSGSGVQNDDAAEIIGIHTHAGCNTNGSGANNGTGINNAGLQDALANPRGVCAVGLSFNYPDGRPETLDPAGGAAFTVSVAGLNGGEPQPGTGMLFYDTGSGFVGTPMNELKDNLYEASFPTIPCGTPVRYYVTAETTAGNESSDPSNAPDGTFAVVSAVSLLVAFTDDFESDLGWSVQNQGGLTDGAWERGVPAGGGDRGDPPADADGSGACYVTDNADGNSDVDDGSTILISPAMDATGGDAFLSYYRWYSNTLGDEPETDIFVIEISNDDGASWVALEIVGPSGPEVNGGWIHRSFRVADLVTPTNQVRVRFNASDLAGGSVVEAAVDGVMLAVAECGQTVLTDILVERGTLLEGGRADLNASDDEYLRIRSQRGFTALEPNVVELIVGAMTTVENPTGIDLGVEARLDQSGGIAFVALKNFQSGDFVTIGQYAIGTTEEIVTFDDIPADLFVRSDGRLEVGLKHVVAATFTAIGFESIFDHVSFGVN